MTIAEREELAYLRNNANLFTLLSHYAVVAEVHLEAWHNRLMHLDGVEPPQMARLHGELIAFCWVEQNTGTAPARYRITLDGWRAMKQAQWVRLGQEDGEDTLKEPHVKVFDITVRPMKNWVLVQPEGVEGNEQLKDWIQRAVKFVGTLPEK